MNTILQSTRRGKLDEETAAAMKKLAKDKMLRALSDQRYASTVYEQEMTQDALVEKAVQKNKQRNIQKGGEGKWIQRGHGSCPTTVPNTAF